MHSIHVADIKGVQYSPGPMLITNCEQALSLNSHWGKHEWEMTGVNVLLWENFIQNFQDFFLKIYNGDEIEGTVHF